MHFPTRFAPPAAAVNLAEGFLLPLRREGEVEVQKLG